jgi:hypothetical protein
MKYFLFLISVFSIFACDQNKQKAKPIADPAETPGYYSAIDIGKWNKEYLSFDSILMNREVPLVTDTTTLFNFLGRPKKIIPISTSRNNGLLIGNGNVSNGNYLIYGNTIFEQFGEKVIVNTIDFESTKIELISSKINLKAGIKPIEIQMAFPESGRLLGGYGGSTWSGNIMVSASKPHGGIHDVWFFIFMGEKLKRVALFSTSMYMEAF